MKHHNNVFHQLLKELPRHQFQKVVDRLFAILRKTPTPSTSTIIILVLKP